MKTDVSSDAAALRRAPSAPQPQPRYRRAAASTYLKETYGLQVATATLARLACEGGGPGYQKAGRAVLYPVAELDAWATKRLGAVVTNTTEAAERQSERAA